MFTHISSYTCIQIVPVSVSLRLACKPAEKARTAQLEQRWQQTTPQQRDAILQHVIGNNKFLQQMHRKDPDSSLIHEQCLSELDNRTAA